MNSFITSARRYYDPHHLLCLLVDSFVSVCVCVLVCSLTYFGAEYLENGWRQRLGYNGTMAYGRDRCCHRFFLLYNLLTTLQISVDLNIASILYCMPMTSFY